MTIERAQSENLDAIRDLLDMCDLPFEDITPASLDHFLVAQDGDGLRGVVGLEPYGDVALLRSLAVVPEFRGEGLGGRLVNAVEQRARDEGFRTLYLLTTTAAGYFGRRGYTKLERNALPEAIQQTEEAARLCPASATCMRKDLAVTEETADHSDPTL